MVDSSDAFQSDVPARKLIRSPAGEIETIQGSLDAPSNVAPRCGDSGRAEGLCPFPSPPRIRSLPVRPEICAQVGRSRAGRCASPKGAWLHPTRPCPDQGPLAPTGGPSLLSGYVAARSQHIPACRVQIVGTVGKTALRPRKSDSIRIGGLNDPFRPDRIRVVHDAAVIAEQAARGRPNR
jgi:hypothetical protein